MHNHIYGLSTWQGGKSDKESTYQRRRCKETRVQSLNWEDLLEGEMATYFNILAWEIPQTRALAGYSPWGHKESDTTEHTHTQSDTYVDILNHFVLLLKLIQHCKSTILQFFKKFKNLKECQKQQMRKKLF